MPTRKNNSKPQPPFVANMYADADTLLVKCMSLAEALKDAVVYPEHLLLCLLLEERFQPYFKKLFARHGDSQNQLVSLLIKQLTPNTKTSHRKVPPLPPKAPSEPGPLFIACMKQIQKAIGMQSGYCLPPLAVKHLLEAKFCGKHLRQFGITRAELLLDIQTMSRDYPEKFPETETTAGEESADNGLSLEKSPLDKLVQTMNKPRTAPLTPCEQNMRRDWQLLWGEAARLAVRRRHARLLVDHFMLALLTFPPYHADLERFFNHSEMPLPWLIERLNLHLDELPKSLRRFARPTLSPAAKAYKEEVSSWFQLHFKGYTLPYLCLSEFQGLNTTEENLPGTLLDEAQLDQSDFFDEMTYLEQSKLEELREGYIQFDGKERPPLWHARTQMYRDTMRLLRGGTIIASNLNHQYVLPEHFLLYLLDTPKYQYYLRNLLEIRYGGHLWQLSSKALNYLRENVDSAKKDQKHPTLTPASEKLLNSLRDATRAATSVCFPVLALRCFHEVDCHARTLLDSLGATAAELEQELQCSFGKPLPGETDPGNQGKPADIAHTASLEFDPFFDDSPTEENDDSLGKFSIELVEEARQGRIDPMVGRSQELERLIEILHKKRSGSAIIVGKEGVGKTAVVEGLALRIAQGKVPDSIKDFKIFSVSLAEMVAGAEFRGVFEKRLTKCLHESMAQGKNFLFFDEIHNLLGAGTNGGPLDASNILKPYLARGQVRCIGATTFEDYQRCFSGNRAFARRFMKLNIGEPSREETLQILQGLVTHYEEYHKVKYTQKILQLIVDLSARYIADKFFPDKAIDVMDECGAHYHSGIAAGKVVTQADVERVVCRMANLPGLTVQSDDRSQLRNLDERLKTNIFGQDEAIGELVRRVKIARAGFQDPRKPLLTAFLCGPSGCGKTELARQLAAELGCSFVKLDMSEYSEEYAASRLIGSAPGYVGYDRPGALTEPVIQTPHCVLLLDEIEKANASVFNILLQVLDEGRLTDNKGREASFRNAIILLTSNAGSRSAEEANNLLGFLRTEADQARNRQEIVQKVMKKTFPPEFRNRLQAIVMMNELSAESLRQIVQKCLRVANGQLAKQKVSIHLTDQAVNRIARLAEEEHLGGRPVERLFDQYVKQRLVDEILFGKLAHGGQVTVDCPDGEFQYQYQKA